VAYTLTHFAEVDNGIVIRVIVAEQDFIDSGSVGDPSRWIQTSYNTSGGIHYDDETGDPSEDQTKSLRKNYAGIDSVYDSIQDAFYLPQPFDSWTLDEESCVWVAPVSMPTDGKAYNWDEETLNWVEDTDIITPFIE
jgi:hypothetical protein